MSEIENDVPWDYVNNDGILICGVCHEPKQQRVEWLVRSADRAQNEAQAGEVQLSASQVQREWRLYRNRRTLPG